MIDYTLFNEDEFLCDTNFKTPNDAKKFMTALGKTYFLVGGYNILIVSKSQIALKILNRDEKIVTNLYLVRQ